MDDADDFLRGRVDDHDGRDFLFFHEVECFAGKELGSDSLRRAHHAVTGSHRERCTTVFFHEATQVAIREDACEFTVDGENRGHAELFGGHFVERGGHGRLWRYVRHGVAGVHKVFDPEKFMTEASSGMEGGKIVGLEAAAFEKRNGEGITEGHGDRGAGSGSEVEGASFFFDADVENDVASAGKSGFGIAGKSDDGHFQTLQCFEEIEDFLGFAPIGDGEQGVTTSKHTQIAVERFGGVEKKGRRAGTGKGGGNLAADEARFAHPRDDNATFTGEEKIDGTVEGSVEASEEIVEGLGLDVKDATCGV